MPNDDYAQDEVRSPQEIAQRALALAAVWCLAMGSLREDVLGWIDDHNLREILSPDELKFVDTERPTEKQRVYFSWNAERIIVLLWALNLIEKLPDADRQCDTRVFKRCLPPLSEQSVEQFVWQATSRSDDELIQEGERIFDLHWQARDAQIHNRSPKEAVDIEIIQERHHAINWVTGYGGMDWDDVATDT